MSRKKLCPVHRSRDERVVGQDRRAHCNDSMLYGLKRLQRAQAERPILAPSSWRKGGENNTTRHLFSHPRVSAPPKNYSPKPNLLRIICRHWRTIVS